MIDYCNNDSQKELIEYLIKGNTIKDAIAHFRRKETNVYRSLRAVSRRMTNAGDGEHFISKKTLPDGLAVKGTSTYYDEDGNVRGQWVKTDKEKEDQLQVIKQALEDFVSNTIPKAELTPVPMESDEKLLCDYTIGDAHVGMYAWAREAGDDFDTDTAVNMLRKAIQYLVSSAPNAHTAFILDVGDFFHSDNQSNETSRSKNKLDVDTRWARVLELGIMCVIDMIDLALQKHQKVIFRAVIGNHNEHTAVVLNTAVKLRYSEEPRVEVLDNPALHNYYQFGKNLLADTHGHTTKANDLPLLMATDVPQMWADTTTRIWRTGHIHHDSRKDYNGCTVETYRTLAAKDAWHAGEGYRSNRDMKCTIYHETNGMIGRNIVNPSMIGY